MIRSFLRDESAATSIEYALIAAMVSMGIITALYGVRTNLNDLFAAVVAGFSS